jgi:hypothetical protein
MGGQTARPPKRKIKKGVKSECVESRESYVYRRTSMFAVVGLKEPWTK